MSVDTSGGGNIGGKSFASLGLLLTKAAVPLLPSVRQVEEELPGRNGTLDLETNFGARQIELTFDFVAATEGEYQTNLSAVAGAFNPVKGQQTLVLDRSPGKQYNVKFNGSIPIEKLATIGEFTVPLKAFNPMPESVIDSLDENTELDDGITLGMGYELNEEPTRYSVTGSPASLSVDHHGNAEVHPLIKITGTSGGAADLTISNDTTSEAMQISTALVSGDVLEIDCDAKTVRLNDANIFDKFSGIYPKLTEGANSFTITADVPDLTIEFIFRHRYLY